MNKDQEVSERNAIYDYLDEKTKFIDKYYINRKPLELRFIDNDGKKILQQLLSVRIVYSREMWLGDDFFMTYEDADIWFDVPLFAE